MKLQYVLCMEHGVETSQKPGLLLLDYERAAEALCMSKQALRDLVYKGRGPRTVRIGRRVFFVVADLEDFIAAHREAG